MYQIKIFKQRNWQTSLRNLTYRQVSLLGPSSYLQNKVLHSNYWWLMRCSWWSYSERMEPSTHNLWNHLAYTRVCFRNFDLDEVRWRDQINWKVASWFQIQHWWPWSWPLQSMRRSRNRRRNLLLWKTALCMWKFILHFWTWPKVKEHCKIDFSCDSLHFGMNRLKFRHARFSTVCVLKDRRETSVDFESWNPKLRCVY